MSNDQSTWFKYKKEFSLYNILADVPFRLFSVQEIVQEETEDALTDIARRRIADTTKMD